MDSAVLGLASWGWGGMLLDFDRDFVLEDAIEFPAFAPLKALACV
jgi:hypothetical protein